MTNYKIVVAYDGRRYKGWRHEKGSSADKSIQGKIESILKKLYQQDIELIGAVSTDAGVHALGQIANFKAPHIQLDEADILDYLSTYLPDDIVVTSIEKVDERFHSRLNAKGITYQYRLWKKDAEDYLLFERHQTYKLNDILNVKVMQEGATLLEGKHDFTAFAKRTKKKKVEKTLSSLTVEETKNEIIITMTANGYLINMERIIVGTLIQLGTGQKKLSTIEKAFETLDPEYAGHKAMAHSLCLVDVLYK